MFLTPESIRTLKSEALQLHLDRHNLVTTSRHQELVEYLLRWYAASHQDSETNSQESSSKSDPKPDHTWTVPGSQTEATTMSKRMGRQMHCPRKLAAAMRLCTMHTVSILGILTSGGNITPITSMMEGTPASISNNRSHHQREWPHTSSHHSHHQHDRGAYPEVQHSLTPLPSKHLHRLTQNHSYSQPSHRSRFQCRPEYSRRTCHAHHSPSSPDSSRDSSSSSLLSDSSDTQSDTSSSLE